MAKKLSHIAIIVVVWIALYVLAIYSVQWALVYGDNRFWASPAWILLYFIPGFIAGYLLRSYWHLAGLLVGVVGSAIWILHSQVPISHGETITNIGFNTLISVAGSWLGQRTKPTNQSAL